MIRLLSKHRHTWLYKKLRAQQDTLCLHEYLIPIVHYSLTHFTQNIKTIRINHNDIRM